MIADGDFCLKPQDLEQREFSWRKSDGTGALSIPPSLLSIFSALFADFHLADQHQDASYLRNGPFLSFHNFRSHMREIEDLMAEFNRISTDDNDHESLLLLGWHSIPSWARSKLAFEKKWGLRVSSLSSLVSHGYVRGNIKDPSIAH